MPAVMPRRGCRLPPDRANVDLNTFPLPNPKLPLHGAPSISTFGLAFWRRTHAGHSDHDVRPKRLAPRCAARANPDTRNNPSHARPKAEE